MPRKGASKNVKSAAKNYEFVRCELSAEDKKTAKLWIEDNTVDMGAIVHDTVASGYKLSCSFSSDFDTFTASLTGKPDESVNEYKTLTARHKEWITAVMTVMYKHTVMFKSQVWETDVDADDDGWA